MLKAANIDLIIAKFKENSMKMLIYFNFKISVRNFARIHWSILCTFFQKLPGRIQSEVDKVGQSLRVEIMLTKSSKSVKECVQ